MKNGENYNNSRRSFLKGIAASLLLLPLLNSCKEHTIRLILRLSGTNHILGHKLRIKNFPKPSRQIMIPYLIVGGGITGLSAARQLTKRGVTDFLLLELEDHLGGNSSYGANQYSKFPLGAHYLPLPNMEDKELLRFLEEEQIILGYDSKGFPIFDEIQLAFAPDERLFYKNSWQEGLVPKSPLGSLEDQEFKRFFSKMEYFRQAKDSSGRYFFDIPMVQSSREDEVTQFDHISMKKWLESESFSSELLLEYVDYCCRDDFGLGIDYVSAWAGIHYFAGRKQNSSQQKNETVLTWPEGNARLADHLKKYATGKSLKNHLVYEVGLKDGKAIAKVFDNSQQVSFEIVADRIIMATPQFVNQYLIENRRDFTSDFHYTPWLLATLVVSDLNDNRSFPLCWDNVIHGSKGLGYVFDQHQRVEQIQSKKVITYYYSFSSADLGKTRRELYKRPKEYWEQLVFSDLEKAHPEIQNVTESIDIHLLGHGMVSPVPGFIFGSSKIKASQSIGNKVFFAHSDLSGISIFEEAFHQGISIVNQIIDGTSLDS